MFTNPGLAKNRVPVDNAERGPRYLRRVCECQANGHGERKKERL